MLVALNMHPSMLSQEEKRFTIVYDTKVRSASFKILMCSTGLPPRRTVVTPIGGLVATYEPLRVQN